MKQSLNDSVELPDTLLNDYTFVPANNPVTSKNGRVGVFHKNSLPVIVRNDLSFDELHTKWQVRTFTDTFINIMSNFISNETKRFVPRNPPRITKPLETMLNRKK